MIPCGWKYFFGIECPGCGLQRSVVALFSGNVWESLVLFPATIPMLLMFIFVALHLWLRFRHGARITMVLFISSTAIMVASYVFKISTHGIHVDHQTSIQR